MAPRIRLSVAKPLPTICETYEEAMEDLTSNPKHTESTSTNPDSYSSDDYIQSICHLARPTFPGLPVSSHKVENRKILQSLEATSWSPSLPETSTCKLTNLISNVMPLGKVTPAPDDAETDFWSREDPLAQIYTGTGKLCSSKGSWSKSSSTGFSQCNSPGFMDTPHGDLQPAAVKGKAEGNPNFPRVFSFPRLPSPRPVQKEMLCSELRYLRRDEGAVLSSNHSQKEGGTMFINGEKLLPCSAGGKLLGNRVLRCSVRKQSSSFNTAGANEKEGREISSSDKNTVGDVPSKQRYSECFQAAKKAVIHNWISEHRCIWKEAKIKACLLPAIAEV
ncbi:uncharacterized protein LOC118173826 [Oxyura jamaicensis]|uniref:uncharacterized protein LOC118173826 n=1 Tax=Oxyura jamaicensis TaxID=8884 RepID=UPI0015A65AE2|nr:uncharacterized protein LOC118173826 [Oxyura jamaicensis]XP_035194619.1 uncharacterized protein LOC118173826 [Oxyura jamaicensis]